MRRVNGILGVSGGFPIVAFFAYVAISSTMLSGVGNGSASGGNTCKCEVEEAELADLDDAPDDIDGRGARVDVEVRPEVELDSGAEVELGSIV
jgi:hypothetical protein